MFAVRCCACGVRATSHCWHRRPTAPFPPPSTGDEAQTFPLHFRYLALMLRVGTSAGDATLVGVEMRVRQISLALSATVLVTVAWLVPTLYAAAQIVTLYAIIEGVLRSVYLRAHHFELPLSSVNGCRVDNISCLALVPCTLDFVFSPTILPLMNFRTHFHSLRSRSTC